MKRLLLVFIAFMVCAAGLIFWLSRQSPSPTPAGLSAYITAERLDPIFAIEGTDPAKLQAALEQFFAVQGRIAARYQGTEKQAVESLYPKNFLMLLPQLEAARQAMLSGQTSDSARAYHNLLVQTITAYAADAQQTSTLIAEAQNTYPTLGFLSGTTSPAYMAQQIDAAGVQAVQIELAKENARYACVSDASKCPSVAALLQNRIASVSASASAVPAPGSAARRIANLVKSLNSELESYTRTEPTIFDITSTCALATTTEHIQAYYLQNQHGTARKLALVDDAYFYDVRGIHAALPSEAAYRILYQAGVDWQYQNIGNLYECPDSGYDQTSVGSLIGVLEALRAQTATSSEAQSILTRGYISKADMAPYIASVAATDTPEADSIVERYLEGSSDFDQVVLGALNDSGFLLAPPSMQTNVSYLFVLAARNYASALFLMGNPTFNPAPQSLLVSHAPANLQNLLLRSYANDLSNFVSNRTLMEQYRKDLEVEFPTTP